MRSRNRATIAAVAVIGVVVAMYVGLSTPPVNPAEHAEDRIEAHVKIPPQVMLTLRAACYDCHSHNTKWPWYSRLPLISQIIATDVRSGRADLNFSRWSM